jgi:S-adenosylmethionine synthetase
VISSQRPFSIEGLSGKNPLYHAGKVYSAAAWDIANKIWQQQQVPCEVYIASQIDRPLNDPWVVVINSTSDLDMVSARALTHETLSHLSGVTDGLLEGKYPLV